MRLIAAHKILIGSAVAFFAFFAVFELRAYAATSGLTELVSGIFGLVAAVGFGVYLRRLWTRDAPGS